MQLPMPLHVWPACLSIRAVAVCVRMRAQHVRTNCACASRLHAPSHRTAGTCGINGSARAARCGRACVVAFGATGRARARWPQVAPGRAAQSRRDGLRDLTTRP
jgi:hypothetical protein